MNERQKDEDQTKKKQQKLIGIVSSITIFCIVMFWAKYLGRQVGRQSAMQTVQAESIAQNAPTGLMGAKWLMTISQVKKLFPEAIDFAPENLKLDTIAFDRSAFVDFVFNDNLLIMIIISFKGEKTEMTYQQTHDLVEEKYGIFPEPVSTSKEILSSKKIIGRIAIEHVLYQQAGIQIEQVVLYRTKSDSVH